jgi:hypothetical protein
MCLRKFSEILSEITSADPKLPQCFTENVRTTNLHENGWISKILAKSSKTRGLSN